MPLSRRLFATLAISGIGTTAIPIPYPRYGTFVDYIRTTTDENLIRAQIAFYDDPSLYEYSPVYMGQWDPVNWTFATVYVDSGRVLAGEPTSNLTTVPEPISDPMLGYTLEVNGTVGELIKENTVVYSLNFSEFIDTDLLLENMENIEWWYGEENVRIPTASFVSQKLDLAYIFFPECICNYGMPCWRLRTLVAIVDFSNPSQEASISELQQGLHWDLLFDPPEVQSVYDSVQLSLLPNDPFAGNSPLYVFYDASGVNAVSSGSYYFPFHTILEAMVIDPSGNSTLNTAWEVYHNFSLVDMPNPYSEWEALVPHSYELREKAMTGEIKRRVVLETGEVESTLSPSSSPGEVESTLSPSSSPPSYTTADSTMFLSARWLLLNPTLIGLLLSQIVCCCF